MGLITHILFPVDFSPSCVAMGPYVKRAAALLDAGVSLIHAFNPFSNSGLEQYVRAPGDIAEEHEGIAARSSMPFSRKNSPWRSIPEFSWRVIRRAKSYMPRIMALI